MTPASVYGVSMLMGLTIWMLLPIAADPLTLGLQVILAVCLEWWSRRLSR
jgi:hypothetical protein